MTQLIKYKLGDIADIQTGPFGSQLHNEDYVVDGTPIVTVEHLGAKKFTTQNLPLVSDEDKQRLHKYILRKNDIVFSRVGSVDRCSFVSAEEDGWLFSGRCLRVRPRPIINAEYLYYILCTNSMKSYIRKKAVGATMPSLNTELFQNIPITVPHISIQNKVASILSTIDSKIELNRQINVNLEALACQLYEYWFVQFDFPNENGKPYKSSGGEMVYDTKLKREIPKGWEVYPLGDVMEPIERGISYSSKDIERKEGIPMINLANFDKKGNYRPDELKFYSGVYKEEDCVKEMDILFACTDLTQDADIIGSPIIVPKQYQSYVFSMDLAKVEPNDKVEKMYLFYALKDKTFHNYIKPFASGTTVKHLSVNGVYSYLVVTHIVTVTSISPFPPQ